MNDETSMMHMCECHVDLSGEKLTVLWFGEPHLIPWPEIKVLQEIHGEQSIYDIKPVDLAPHETPNREKERMALKYGRDPVEAVYAGKGFNMEWFMPGWPVNPKEKKKGGVNTRAKKVFQHAPEEADTNLV